MGIKDGLEKTLADRRDRLNESRRIVNAVLTQLEELDNLTIIREGDNILVQDNGGSRLFAFYIKDYNVFFGGCTGHVQVLVRDLFHLESLITEVLCSKGWVDVD